MIYQVLQNDEVTQLKDDLESELPGSAKIYYILKNYIRGLLDGFEVIVDEWPSWSCIVLRPLDGGERAPPYFRHYYICHARKVSALRFFIQRPGVIDWFKEATFTGVPCDIVPFLQEFSRKRLGELRNIQPRFMYAWTKPEPPEEPRIPPGLRLTTLTQEHAEILRQDWKNIKVDSGLDTYFRGVIRDFDSSALIDESGNLLAYICMQFNGSMAMTSGAPEHQGKGYGQIVLSDLTRKLLAKKEIAYGFIPSKDSNLISITQDMGYTWVPQGNMTWLRYSPSVLRPLPVQDGPPEVEHSQSQEDGVNIFINAIPLVVQEMADSSNKSAICKVGIS